MNQNIPSIEDLVIESAEGAIRWHEQLNPHVQPWNGVGGLLKVSDDSELRETGVVRIQSRGRISEMHEEAKVARTGAKMASSEERERLKQLYESYQASMASFSTSVPQDTPIASSFSQPPLNHPSLPPQRPTHRPPASQPSSSQHNKQDEADLLALYQSPSVAEARREAGLPPYLAPSDTTDILNLPKPPKPRT